MDNKAFEFRMKPRKDQGDDVIIPNTSEVTVLPKDQALASMSSAQSSVPSKGTSGGGHPAMMVVEVVNTALGLVDTTIKTIGEVKLAREKTNQVRVQAEATISLAREQTKQIKVQEKEATKRYEMQMNRELDEAKLKLKEEQSRLNIQLKERKLSHKETMETLKIVEGTVRALTLSHEELIEQFKSARLRGEAVDHSIQNKLLDSSRAFVDLVDKINHLR